MSSSNPLTILLIPGMFCKATVYDPLIHQLTTTHNLTHLQALDLPTADAIKTGADLSLTHLEADIAAIRTAITALTARGHDVLLVAHSYGGTPALHASRALWKHAGRGAGVTKALLLCSSLCLAGESVGGVRGAWAAANPQSPTT